MTPKNTHKKMVESIIFVTLAGMVCIISVLFFAKINEYYLIITIAAWLAILSILFLHWKKKTQQVVIDLFRRSTVTHSLLYVMPYIILLSAMLLIPKEYVFIVLLVLFAWMLFILLIQRRLVIDDNGVRLIFYWELNWEQIKSYDLDSESGILHIKLKNSNNTIQIENIAQKDFPLIEKTMNHYLNLS